MMSKRYSNKFLSIFIFFLISFILNPNSFLFSAPNYYYYPNFNYQKYRELEYIDEEALSEKIEEYLKKKVPSLEVSYRDVIDAIIAEGHQVYLKGGMVRDLLSLNPTEPRDIDFDYTGTREELRELLQSKCWLYSQVPNRATIKIGNHRKHFMEAFSVDDTINPKEESYEFTINNIFYCCKTRRFLPGSESGFRDLIYDRLNIRAKDWNDWLMRDENNCSYKIFRFWKMVGKGYVYSTELMNFFVHKTHKIIVQDKKKFHQELLGYISQHYFCFDEIYHGSVAVMGFDWSQKHITAIRKEAELEDKILKQRKDKYTFFN